MRSLLLIAALLCFPIAATADNHSPTKPTTLKAGERLKCYARHHVQSFWYNMEVDEFGMPVLDHPANTPERNQKTWEQFKRRDSLFDPEVFIGTDYDSFTEIDSVGSRGDEWQRPPPGAANDRPIFYVRKQLARLDNEDLFAHMKFLFENTSNEVFMVNLGPGHVDVQLCVKD